MKIFYDERGKRGKYFEIFEDFPKIKKIKGIFSYNSLEIVEKINFNYSLENVIDGSYAFCWNWSLESFNSNLCKLENGENMFHCSQLKSFSSDLPSLTNGVQMFYQCTNLTSFSSDLSSLTYGYMMFQACTSLTSFSSDLSSLIYGERMFQQCNNLNSFSSKLSSLKSGYNMFSGCELDAESLSYIANNINNLVENGYDKKIDEHWKYEVLGKIKTIPSSYRGLIDIGHDKSIAQNVINDCGNILIEKGWDVYFNGNEYTKVETE